ncbi:hypothetical protein UlMin_014759 [Ulmus minor]
MVADKPKKSKVAPEEEEENDHVDASLVLAIEKLQEVQDDLEKVNEEASDEVLEIEQKYNEIRRPVYLRRNEVVKTIPDFWLTAFLSHPSLVDILSDEDQKILKYLDSLDVEESKDVKSGYSITFNFNENPYFEDRKLTKTFTFFDEGTTKITGTTIKWKEGKAAVNGVTHDKQGNKRPLEEQSFFTWFSETEQKDGEDFQDEVAELIKEDLWPNPLKYFSNEGDDVELYEVYEDDEEDADDDEQDDDEDGEDEKDTDEEICLDCEKASWTVHV